MLEPNDVEEVLTRVRPVGPRATMVPPAELTNATVRRPKAGNGSRIVNWMAGAALVAVVALWVHGRPGPVLSPESEARARVSGSGPANRTVQDVPPGSSREHPVRVGGKVAEPKRLRWVVPTYSVPPDPGIVAILELTVDPQGHVDAVRILRGQPVAAEEAATAVRQWEYEPMVIDDQAVWFLITVVLYPA